MPKKFSVIHTLFLINLSIFLILLVIEIGFQTMAFSSLLEGHARYKVESTVKGLYPAVLGMNAQDIAQKVASARSQGVQLSVINQANRCQYGLDLYGFTDLLDVRAQDGTLYHVITDLLDDSVLRQVKQGDGLDVEGYLVLDGGNNVLPCLLASEGKKGSLYRSNVVIAIDNSLPRKMAPIADADPSASPEVDRDGLLTVENYRVPAAGPAMTVVSSFDLQGQGIAATGAASALGSVKFSGTIITPVPPRNKRMFAQRSIMIDNMNKELEQGWPLDSNGSRIITDEQSGGDYMTSITAVPELGWHIIANVSLLSVGDVVALLNRYVIAIFVIAFILLMFTSAFYAQALRKPLVEMSTMADRISNEDFSASIALTADNELGQLGQSLNRISTSLSRRISSLEAESSTMQEARQRCQQNMAEDHKLLASMTHELKTPLTIINGYVHGFKAGIYTHADGDERFTLILQEVEKADQLIAEMITMSKLNTYQLTANRENFDLGLLFLRVMERVEPIADQRGMSIVYDYHEDSIIYADPNLMEQVLTNLLVNAIYHAPENSQATVLIEKQENAVLFSIANASRLYTSAELTRIWEPFYRSESPDEAGKGSGLGLFIVKRILDLQGYSIHVINGDGMIEFCVTCPIGGASSITTEA